MQHQSTVLWQSHFQGHTISVLDTLEAILATTEQTGIGSAAINLLQGERSVLLFLNASCLVPGYEDMALLSDIRKCGNFSLAPST